MSKQPDKHGAIIFVVTTFLLCFIAPSTVTLAILGALMLGIVVYYSMPHPTPQKDQGNALSWIVVLGTIFICALAYIIFTPVMYQLKVLANATGVNVSSGTTGGNIFATFEYWPMIVIVGMIIWAFVLAQKKEPDSGMYY